MDQIIDDSTYLVVNRIKAKSVPFFNGIATAVAARRHGIQTCHGFPFNHQHVHIGERVWDHIMYGRVPWETVGSFPLWQ
jgi:hypothetical protein